MESGDSPYWEACLLKRRGAETRAWEVKRPPVAAQVELAAALSCMMEIHWTGVGTPRRTGYEAF